MKPWERQSGESAPAYAAAWAYFQMGSERSLSAVARNFHKSKTLLARWSVRWRWAERAEAYDRHLHRLALDAQNKALAEEVERWEKRRSEQREREWSAAEALLSRAQQMLQLPLTITTEDEGRTVIQPARWSMRDVALFLDVASKLARRAAEMDTDNQKVDAKLKKALNEFFDKLETTLPEDLYGLVLEKLDEDEAS